MSLVEDQQTLGTGWNTITYARDLAAIIRRIKRIIKLLQKTPNVDISTLSGTLPASVHGFELNSVVTEIIDKVPIEYSLGSYKIEDDYSIRITELPRRSWTDTYIHGCILMRCSQCKDKIKLCIQCSAEYEKKRSLGMKYRNRVATLVDRSEDDDVDIHIIMGEGGLNDVASAYVKKTNIDLLNFEKAKKKLAKIEAQIRDLDGDITEHKEMKSEI